MWKNNQKNDTFMAHFSGIFCIGVLGLLIVLISNLKYETKSGKKQQETIYKGILILDSLKGISHW